MYYAVLCCATIFHCCVRPAQSFLKSRLYSSTMDKCRIHTYISRPHGALRHSSILVRLYRRGTTNAFTPTRGILRWYFLKVAKNMWKRSRGYTLYKNLSISSSRIVISVTHLLSWRIHFSEQLLK